MPDQTKPIPTTKVNLQLVDRGLDLISVDDHFAPSKEMLDIKYEIKGLSLKKVMLDIYSVEYGSDPLYSHELIPVEKANGTHLVHWDGHVADSMSGELQNHYIHPLYAPYTVHLYCPDNSKYSDQMEFKVLYHSLDIVQGLWTPDENEPPQSDEKTWVQFKLNQLGYYGGPVGNDTENYLSKAIIRYKANHKDLHELVYANYTDTITSKLKQVLTSNDNSRQSLTGDAISSPSGKSTIWVEALTYESYEDEFKPGTKSTDEFKRLNRPLIPLEAEIFLKTKSNSKVSVPEAVGPVRVNWRFKDANEDLSNLPTNTRAEPSHTKAFVEKCLKLLNGCVGTNGDNCPRLFGGIREEAAANYATPFLLGDYYTPYHTEIDGEQMVVRGNACVDKANYPRRLGKAGIFFRPSYISGDDYKLTAEIDFNPRFNKDQLETLHGVSSDSTRIHDETGVFRIQRFNKAAALINWPERGTYACHKSDEWHRIQDEFNKAHMDIDVSGIVTKTIMEIITLAEYQQIVISNTPHNDPSKISLFGDAMVGVALPEQGKSNAADYKDLLKSFVYSGYWVTIQSSLRTKISEKVRKEHPIGFIIVNFLSHKPVNIMNNPGGGNGVLPDYRVKPENSNFVTWTSSVGMADSVIFVDQRDPDKVYYVVAHEMGHNNWLKHWENTPEGPTTIDHDTNDHNCMMSYSDIPKLDFAKQGVYTPHFCGKCNLKLRGWLINGTDDKKIPASSA